MKKIISITLVSLVLSSLLLAQESVRPTFTNILTPYIFPSDVSMNGKILLFDKEWVKGKLLTANNTVISNDSFLFNFDKIDKRLLATIDFNKVFEIDWREFKAVLFYWHDTGFVFKHIYPLSNNDLFQVLINGSEKYSLYKTVHMKIVKEYYFDIGTPAKTPEKYLNLPEYCILFPNREYRIIHSIKRGAIERLFSLDPDFPKVNEYLNATLKAVCNEEYLKNLINYLNRETL
jgi:hypothetical protein